MRFFCCLVVMMGHLGFLHLFPVLTKWSTTWVLSLFFLISGFMMVYSYLDRDIPCSVTDNLKFSIGKIRKLYPLHVETACIQFVILFCLFFLLSGKMVASSIARFLFRFGVNLALLQSWVPDRKNYIMNFNGPSWFLSVMLFAYFMFPWILKLLQKLRTTSKILILTAIIVAVNVVSMAIIAVNTNYDGEIYYWYQGNFPITQTVLFFEGCVFGYLYHIHKKEQGDARKEYSAALWTVIEVIVIVFFFAGSVLVKKISNGEILPGLRPVTDCYAFVPMIFCTPLIYIFIVNRGYITKLCCARPLMYLGDISLYIYLIHYIFANLLTVYDAIVGENTMAEKIIIRLVLAAITILISAAYNKHQKTKKAKKEAAAGKA